MPGDSGGIPPMIRQGQLISEVARAVVGAVDQPWTKLMYRTMRVAPYGQEGTYITKPDGEIELDFPSRGVPRLVRELREVMYRPGTGTWFTFTLTVTPQGGVDAQFNYDDEPEWDLPQEPVLYVEDLERFPRDGEHIPAWLQEKLRLGRIQDSEWEKTHEPRRRWTPITEATPEGGV
ncbi:MAG: hypothetical protein ACRCSP_00190 [Rhodoglobus sp.]